MLRHINQEAHANVIFMRKHSSRDLLMLNCGQEYFRHASALRYIGGSNSDPWLRLLRDAIGCSVELTVVCARYKTVTEKFVFLGFSSLDVFE